MNFSHKGGGGSSRSNSACIRNNGKRKEKKEPGWGKAVIGTTTTGGVGKAGHHYYAAEEDRLSPVSLEDYRSPAKTSRYGFQKESPAPASPPEKGLYDSYDDLLAPRRQRHHRLRGFLGFLHVLLVTLLVLVFASLAALEVIERYVRDYFIPEVHLMHRGDDAELTYYERTCDNPEDALTATTPEQLVVPEGKSARQHFARHGIAVFPEILSKETAAELREFILEENERNKDTVSVFKARNRRSFELQIDHHQSVLKASKEILSHRHLVEGIEAVVGKNPAVIEFTSITAFNGAAIQPYHSDSGLGANFYSRSFFPAYSLFIPLQDTTQTMGPTEVCPGTHVCLDQHEFLPSFCERKKIRVSFAQIKNQNNSATTKTSEYWPTGTAALISQQTHHRGQAHSLRTLLSEEEEADIDDDHVYDDDATDDDASGLPTPGERLKVKDNSAARVMFYFTFAPRPRFGRNEVETRVFPINGTLGQHWAQWGFTLRDYQDPERYMRWPWRTLRTLGLYKPRGRQWGWDYLRVATFGLSQAYNYDVSWNLDRPNDHHSISEYIQQLDVDDVDEGKYAVEAYEVLLKPLRSILFRIYAGVLLCYFFVEYLRRRQLKRGNTSIPATMCFVLLMHAIVLGLAFSCLDRISKTSWARNIRAGRLYRPSTSTSYEEPTESETPTPRDILVLDHVRSDYLGVLEEEKEFAHPGNLYWKRGVEKYSHSFERFPSFMQRQLCSRVLDKVLRTESRRIMYMTESFHWDILGDDDAMRFCHKEMMRHADPSIGEAIIQLDYLLAETQFGYWRDTAMHRTVIRPYLRSLQDRVMRFDRVSSQIPLSRSEGTGSPFKLQLMARYDSD